MVKTNDMMSVEDVLEILSVKLLGVVPEDDEIIVSTNKGEPIAATESGRAGQAYRNIARRIRGEEVPFLDLSVANDTWIDKIVKIFSPVRA